ncbi:MAG: DNA-directed RNA polymerase subunit A', partial [archaeon]
KANGLRKKVTDLNKKQVTEEHEVGSKIERTLQDGDIVLFNRQPSLHRLSMLAHEVKVVPNKAIRMNPIVCKPYNADFDGDEMNLHVPQTQEGIAEARELMFVQDQIVSPRHGNPVITGQEDDQSGLFILTMDQTEFTREEAMHFLYKMGISELPEADRGKKYSGKKIFSHVLPKDLTVSYPNNLAKTLRASNIPKEGHEHMYKEAVVKIKDGVLESGIVDGTPRLIESIARNYAPEVLEQFYYKMSRINHELLTMKGISGGISEFEQNDFITKARTEAIQEEMTEGEALTKKFLDGTLEPIPGRTVPESFELMMVQLGTGVRARVQAKIAERKMNELFDTPRPTLDSFPIIVSGARGSLLNLGFTSGVYGQISIRSGRPKKGYIGRLITVNSKGDIGPKAGGFVQSNFVLGMSPTEYFMHSMGGRQGEMDTGVATKVSGYLYRRLANSLKDLHVANDETVRSANKDIVQFRYGEDGIFPGRTSGGNFVNIEEVWRKLQQVKEKKK